MSTTKLLSSFTPSLMTAETLEAIFVAREVLLERLHDAVRHADSTDGARHTLLVGPRGIGKTHLTTMLSNRVSADEQLTGTVFLVWPAEDPYGITSYQKFLRWLLKASGVAAGRGLDAAGLESSLLAQADGRTVVVLIENLDEVFGGIGTSGQQAFRAFIENHPDVILIATTPSLFSGVSREKSPFYGFFSIEHLGELTLEEARELLRLVATWREDNELARYLATDIALARLRVVELLAGGHPRIWMLFADRMTIDNVDELVPALVAAVDDLTPYYQSRLRELPAQQQELVAYAIEERGALTVKEFAEGCDVDERSAAAQLKTLAEKGYVRRVAHEERLGRQDGRSSHYELREPLMRLAMEVKESRDQPLALIVEFLRAWFSPSERQQQLLDAEPASLKAEYLAAAQQADTQAVQEAAEDGIDLVALFAKGRFADVLAAFTTAAQLDPTDFVAHYNRGICLRRLDRNDDALTAFTTATQLDPAYANAHYDRGITLERLGRHTDAIAALVMATRLDPTGGDPLLGISEIEFSLGAINRAEEALARGLALEAHGANVRDATSSAVASARRGLWNSGALLAIYVEHSRLDDLATAVVADISNLSEELANRDHWVDFWREAAGAHPELEIAARLLETADAWLRTNDANLLLALSSPERAILTKVLGIADAD